MAVTALGVAMHRWLPLNSVLTVAATAGISVAVVILVAFLLGIRVKDVREEVLVLRGIFAGK
jgi:hypothetical protein